MENHHGQSSTCHRLDLYIVNTSHGRIDQSPRRTRHAAHPVDLSTSRTMEQNVKQAAPWRCQRPSLDAVRLLVFLWHRQLRVASVNWPGPTFATLQALTLLRWVPGLFSDLNCADPNRKSPRCTAPLAIGGDHECSDTTVYVSTSKSTRQSLSRLFRRGSQAGCIAGLDFTPQGGALAVGNGRIMRRGRRASMVPHQRKGPKIPQHSILRGCALHRGSHAGCGPGSEGDHAGRLPPALP